MPDTRVHVDFNDIQHGRLRALSRNADDPSAIAPGAQVELWDDDGNTAQGRVVELADRGLVWFELIRGTWRDPVDRPQPDPDLVQAWWPAAWIVLGSGLSVVLGSGYGHKSKDASWNMAFISGPPSMHVQPLHEEIEDYYKLSLATGAAPVAAGR